MKSLKPLEVLLAEKSGGLVHPLQYKQKSDDGLPEMEIVVPGMTYRQWLIGMAMQGDFVHGPISTRTHSLDEYVDRRIEIYEQFADRIIARLMKEPE